METQEMRDFFQRVVDHVATLSTQAERVSGLEQQVSELRNRISSLEQSNYDLQQQLSDAQNRYKAAKVQAEKFKGDFVNEQSASVALRETIGKLDNAVNNLTGEFRLSRIAIRSLRPILLMLAEQYRNGRLTIINLRTTTL